MGRRLPRRGAQEPTLALFRAPPTGGTDAAAPKAAPKSAANICDKDTLTRCRACCAAGCGQSAPHNTSLARAYSSAATAPQHLIASAGMLVRRGARPGREHHHRTHTTCAPHAQFGCAAATPRVAERRRRCGCCKHSGVIVAPAPASAYSQGTIPPVRFFGVRRRGRGASGARLQRGDQRGRNRASALASSGGAPVAPWHRGEASLWSPVVDERSNGRARELIT